MGEKHPSVEHLYPFNVIGLQQMVINDKLLLAIVVVPSVELDENYLPPNKAGTKVCKMFIYIAEYIS